MNTIILLSISFPKRTELYDWKENPVKKGKKPLGFKEALKRIRECAKEDQYKIEE